MRDTEIGIDPELLPNVFELFTQSSRSPDRAQGGLGIGLTLVKRLVELHGGTVFAHSDGSGHGSTFVVRLPAVDAPKQIKQTVHLPRTVQRRRILVVDDNVGAARILSLLLMKLGDHEVETVYDGPSTLARVKELRPEIVFLDIGLPGVDGYQVARAIRDMLEHDGMLLVALTGYGQQEDRQRSREAGFGKHFVKPVHASELKALLEGGKRS